MNRNNWSVLDNGDSEGDGEPDITCDGCGEDGYNCYCGLHLPTMTFACRYCGTDCGENGCHVVDDPDDAAAALIAQAAALEAQASELTPHPCPCPGRCLCHAKIDLRDRRAKLQVDAEYLREEAALLRGAS